MGSSWIVDLFQAYTGLWIYSDQSQNYTNAWSDKYLQVIFTFQDFWWQRIEMVITKSYTESYEKEHNFET